MATKKPKTVLYRRKREGKTNYDKRMKLLLSKKARLVVRFTNTQIIAQLVEFTVKGDKVLVAVNSASLKKLGWGNSFKNRPAAYLTGLLIGKKAEEKGVTQAVLDTGFKTLLKKGKLATFFKGVIDSGLNVPHGSEEIFPDEDMIMGKNINDQIAGNFDKVKSKIMG